jgi:hypothetical protein
MNAIQCGYECQHQAVQFKKNMESVGLDAVAHAAANVNA